MKACPVGLAGLELVVAVREPGASFCTASSTEAVECMMPAHVRLLAGSTGSTASFLDCLAAALQDLLRRHTPPQALHMSRRGSRGAARVLCIGFSTASDVCRSLRGPWYLCFVCGHTCNRACGEEHRDKNSDRDDISYRVRCSDEYDTLQL